MSCFLAGDGGDLKLTPLPDGSLKVGPAVSRLKAATMPLKRSSK